MSDGLDLELFQHLTIDGGGEALADFRRDLLARIAPPWTLITEDDLSRPFGYDDILGVRYEGDDTAPPVRVTLALQNNEYSVANIVPEAMGQISRAQYNHVLQAFAAQLAQPAAASAALTPALSSPHVTLEQSFGDAGAKALRQFSAAANMSSGSSHPSDRQRWYRFILAVQDVPLEGMTVGRWLMKLGWPEEVANDLAVEFEFGQGLLDEEHGR